jgi:hypothetical protein
MILRRYRFPSAVAMAALGLMVMTSPLAASAASTPTGQVAFGQATVEPAINDADGSTVFLLTPNKAPFPSMANPQHAVAPLYLPVYPVGSTIDPSTLNCQPSNCDHVRTFFYPIIGHDHLVGVRPTGDFNVAWHVWVIAFTPKGFADGAINTRLMTLSAIQAAQAAGDVFPIDSGITFNCSIVSQTVYNLGTPLHF